MRISAKVVTENIIYDNLLSDKSSGYKSHTSLDAFCTKFSARVGERFLVYMKDYRKDGATTLLPVVMTMML